MSLKKELGNCLSAYFIIKLNETMNFWKSTFIFLLLLGLTSCKTTDTIGYFQNINQMGNEQIGSEVNTYQTRITADDQLSILVSGVDPISVAPFNLPVISIQPANETLLNTANVQQTYLVNSLGDIDFPVIGKLHVAGFSCSELSDLLKEKIAAYVKSPIVNVKIQNFKISVLGEVVSPGTKRVSSERISILEAISEANDLTIQGRRDNILIIRDNNGRKEYQRIDLTDANLFLSPYYYLRQNDIVYVEPNEHRKHNARYNQSKQLNISLASTIISAVSVIASLTIALLVK